MLKNKRPRTQPLHNKSDDSALETRLEETLNFLSGFHDQEIDMSLERVERFLAQLDNPHLKLPPVIHVAGTNGKGSTIAILRSLLEESGQRVHIMTSPHLVHPTERIRIAGDLISTQGLLDVLEECLTVNQSAPITFFEMLTAAAFLAMSRTAADYVLLETGMGGRLDATNVIPDPLCTIITTLSKDHEEFLGSDLKSIAFEKAGIIKAGAPCVIGYQTQEAIDAGVINVFHEISKALSPEAELYIHGSEWDIETVQEEMEFSFKKNGQDESILTSLPNLIGQHQIYNCGAALAAYRIIMGQDFDASILSTDNPQNPLGIIHWPGRLQKIESGALRNILKPTQELWLDGGHNDSAGKFLADQAGQWRVQDNKPLHLVIAMVNRKDPSEFLGPLIPYAASITVTSIPDEATTYSADELYALIEPLGFKNLFQAETIEEALARIKKTNARILVAGSLYFVGGLLE